MESKYTLAAKLEDLLKGEDLNMVVEALRIVTIEKYGEMQTDESELINLASMVPVGGEQ